MLSRRRTQTAMSLCSRIAIASFLKFAKFKAELRNRLGAKRCGCSEEVLILVLIFDSGFNIMVTQYSKLRDTRLKIPKDTVKILDSTSTAESSSLDRTCNVMVKHLFISTGRRRRRPRAIMIAPVHCDLNYFNYCDGCDSNLRLLKITKDTVETQLKKNQRKIYYN